MSRVPLPVNDQNKTYLPHSPERTELKTRLAAMAAERIDIPLVIGGCDVRSDRVEPSVMPHQHRHVLADWHLAEPTHVQQAIDAALAARREWGSWPLQDRAAVFLRAAELLTTTWRATLNAATMLGQSKTVIQAEIDAASELIDFWRFNPHYAQELYEEQPLSSHAMWNSLEYRPLEGFVYAVTPFNFTSIAGNLPTAPALMGNTVIWKPASSAMLSAHYILELLEAAGLPPGVINLVAGSPAEISNILLDSPDLGRDSLHRQHRRLQLDVEARWRQRRAVSELSASRRRNRRQGLHRCASLGRRAGTRCRDRARRIRYQGQKCSAASRVYVPQSMWPDVKDRAVAMMREIRMGDIADFRTFMGAVIDQKSYTKISGYLDDAKKHAKVIHGGGARDDEGYFIEPTLVETNDPGYRLLCEEIFGPVVTAYAYPDSQWSETLEIVDRTSPYALTGAIFANDRAAIREASNALRNAAGNFYVNDKPTGAVVGQQPFGGARASGTNDKAGSKMNLLRWVSARAMKETFSPPRVHTYPYMSEE